MFAKLFQRAIIHCRCDFGDFWSPGLCRHSAGSASRAVIFLKKPWTHAVYDLSLNGPSFMIGSRRQLGRSLRYRSPGTWARCLGSTRKYHSVSFPWIRLSMNYNFKIDLDLATIIAGQMDDEWKYFNTTSGCGGTPTSKYLKRFVIKLWLNHG